MEHNEVITTRRYEGQTYTFRFNYSTAGSHVACDTPANCFGYPDTVILSTKGRAYTLHRYLPPWILRKIEKVLIDLTAKYVDLEEYIA